MCCLRLATSESFFLGISLQAWHHTSCVTQPSGHLNSGKSNVLALPVAHSGPVAEPRALMANGSLDIMSNLNATADMM
jgi:hypothetical protein